MKTKKKTAKKISQKSVRSTAKRTLKTKKAQPAKKLESKPKVPVKPLTPDPAHSPGHKKMQKTDKFTEHSRGNVHMQEAAANTVSKSEIIRKQNSRHRRIITGAAMGKTGRIIIK